SMNHRWMTVEVVFITIDGAEQSTGALEGQANSVDCLSSARPRVNRLPVAGPGAGAGAILEES
ncbi:MAG: hypothetical protein ACXVCF_03470, partial [Isosphaeraceae bacterium]